MNNKVMVCDLNSGNTQYLTDKDFINFYSSTNFCFGYARQSTNTQKSLEEQIWEIKLKAKENKFDTIVIFQNKGSGWNVNNLNKLEEFKKMVKLIPQLRKFTSSEFIIYIYDVSRFMRNVMVATKFFNDIFDPNDCKIYSIIDNKIWDKDNKNRNEFLKNLLEAENSSILLSLKMKNNIKYRKKRGHHVGGIPYGYERYKNHNLIHKIRKNKNEQKILGYLKRAKKNNIKYNFIVHYLNSNNLLKRKKKWNVKMINRIINNTDFSKVNEYNFENDIKESFDNWIQCDICNKWRKMDMEYYLRNKTKEFFNCSDIPCLNCNIPEEFYEADTEDDIMDCEIKNDSEISILSEEIKVINLN